MIEVDDFADPRLAVYRELKDATRAREGRFIAEGHLVVEALLQSRYPVESLLVSEKYTARVPQNVAAPVYFAPQAVFDRIAGFHVHRGFLAAGRRVPLGLEALLASAPRSVVVLEGISNHDNVGGIFRNAAAFGAGAVIAIQSADPLYRRALRVSMGAVLFVPYAEVSDSAALRDRLLGAGYQNWALTLEGERELHQLPVPPKVALWAGSEGFGLSAAARDGATGVRIRMTGGIDSLNVATATGIALHQIAVEHGKTA